MSNIRALALSALIATGAPAVASASSASFDLDASIFFSLTAPGATFDIVEAFSEADTFATGAASAGVTTSPDPLVFALPFDADASASGSATDPGGFAEAFGAASLLLEVFNDTASPIDGFLSWDLSIGTDASAISGPLFADAASFLSLFFIAELTDADDPIADAELFAETDALFGPFGPAFDGDGGSADFTIAPGEALFIDAFVVGSGFAEVAVPLPASILFGLSGLAAIGALRLRKS